MVGTQEPQLMYIPFHNLASAGGVVVATMLFRHMCAVMMRKGACEAKHKSFMMQHTYGQVHSLQHCDTTQLHVWCKINPGLCTVMAIEPSASRPY